MICDAFYINAATLFKSLISLKFKEGLRNFAVFKFDNKINKDFYSLLSIDIAWVSYISIRFNSFDWLRFRVCKWFSLFAKHHLLRLLVAESATLISRIDNFSFGFLVQLMWFTSFRKHEKKLLWTDLVQCSRVSVLYLICSNCRMIFINRENRDEKLSELNNSFDV